VKNLPKNQLSQAEDDDGTGEFLNAVSPGLEKVLEKAIGRPPKIGEITDAMVDFLNELQTHPPQTEGHDFPGLFKFVTPAIDRVLRRALGRPPTTEEVGEAAKDFLNEVVSFDE
jgi:hypothetical protein